MFLANTLLQQLKAIAQHMNQVRKIAREKRTLRYLRFIAKMKKLSKESADIAESTAGLFEDRREDSTYYPPHSAPFRFDSDYRQRETFSDHLHALVSRFLEITRALEAFRSSPGKQTHSPSNERTPLDEIASHCAMGLCLCGGYLYIYDQQFRSSLEEVPGISVDADPNTGCRVYVDARLFEPQTQEAQKDFLSKECFLPNIAVTQERIQQAYNELVKNFNCVINGKPLKPMRSTEKMAQIFISNLDKTRAVLEQRAREEQKFAQAYQRAVAEKGYPQSFPPQTGNA
ncbi:MAG: hypothetical protein KatS3mg099_161 [Candidatus Parcubacteria bacterium]|nr:MAG: hypothetical protein KatS3mg099_161 [Candidatus Parcubacteria bacterium]